MYIGSRIGKSSSSLLKNKTPLFCECIFIDTNILNTNGLYLKKLMNYLSKDTKAIIEALEERISNVELDNTKLASKLKSIESKLEDLLEKVEEFLEKTEEEKMNYICKNCNYKSEKENPNHCCCTFECTCSCMSDWSCRCESWCKENHLIKFTS